MIKKNQDHKQFSFEASLSKHHQLGIDCDVFSLGSPAQTGAKYLSQILAEASIKN